MHSLYKLRVFLLALFLCAGFFTEAQISPPFDRTDSLTAVRDYNLWVNRLLDIPHGIDTAASHALKGGLDSLGLIYFDHVHHLLYIRDSIGVQNYWKAIPIGTPGAVTSFNTRTGAVTLVAADVITALGGTPLLAANNLSDLTNVVTARTNLGLAAIASTGDWSDVQNKPTTLAGYGITDPVVLTSGSYSNPSWITSLAFSKITGFSTLTLGSGLLGGSFNGSTNVTAKVDSSLFTTITYVSLHAGGSLDKTISIGDTAFDRQVYFNNAAGKSVFLIDPRDSDISANIYTTGASVAGIDLNWTGYVTINALHGATFSLNGSGYSNTLLTQASQTITGENVYFGNSGNATDTIAYQSWVRANFAPASFTGLLFGRTDTRTGVNMLFSVGNHNFEIDSASTLYFHTANATAALLVRASDSSVNVNSSTFSLQVNKFNIVGLSSPTSAINFFQQAAANYSHNLYWPIASAGVGGNDTLATKADVRTAGAGAGTVTSIATSQGILGGTITTTGTIKADTSYLVRTNDSTGSGTNTYVTLTYLTNQSYITSALTSGKIWIGNVSNIAAAQTPSGDWTINNAGVTTIANNVVSNAKFRQSTANKLVGNPTGSTANVTDIGLGNFLQFVAGNLADTATHITDFTNDAGYLTAATDIISRVNSTVGTNTSFVISSGYEVMTVIVIPASTLASFQVGTTSSGNDVIGTQAVGTAGVTFNINGYFASGATLYFQGITSSTQIIIVQANLN